MAYHHPLGQSHERARWAFPVVESLHFIGMALSIGTIAIVDLRLLGIAMCRQTASDLEADLHRWTWSGLALMLIAGPLMFSADAPNYHRNPAFHFKMTSLFLALVFKLYAAPLCAAHAEPVASGASGRGRVARSVDLRCRGRKNDRLRLRNE
jgi:hypothetical protein